MSRVGSEEVNPTKETPFESLDSWIRQIGPLVVFIWNVFPGFSSTQKFGVEQTSTGSRSLDALRDGGFFFLPHADAKDPKKPTDFPKAQCHPNHALVSRQQSTTERRPGKKVDDVGRVT